MLLLNFTCLECVDHFYLVLFSQSLDTVVEQSVDVVLDPLNLLPIYTLQLGLQVLQVYLKHDGGTGTTNTSMLSR